MRRWRGDPWAVLVTLSLGFFLTLLDLTAVNVALPSMIGGLGASLDEALWVINVYVLVLAALLITAGRLGDVHGPRALFAGGVALFTLASVLCALAQGPAQLIAARAVQGLGAAALLPQTMTLIIAAFPPERRGAALGVWGGVAGLATIAGPTLGGFLVAAAGWRWIFVVNVPVGVAVLVLAAVLVPDVRQGARHRLDVPGVVLATAALLCLTFGLTEGQRYGWNAGIWALLAGSVVLLAVFLVHQASRQDREPLLPFALFRDRGFAVMSGVAAAVQVGMIGLFLPVMLYLQSVLAFGALEAGLVMAPAMVVSALVSPVAGRMADRSGGTSVLVGGLVSFGTGMAWLALAAGVESTWYGLQAPLLVAGAGTGCVFGPMVSVAMRGVEPAMAGAASGVLNTIRQIGTIAGSAAVGAVLQNRLAAAVRDEASRRAGALPADVRGGFVAGFGDVPGRGLGAGAGRAGGALDPPPGTPPGVAEQIRQAAASAYEHGFVHAMRPALALPVAVIAAGAVACALVRGGPVRRRPPSGGARIVPDAGAGGRGRRAGRAGAPEA
ncbi:DHA2 family efflux MFS transporter permease subunit [Actinomadura graeca]|uniref:DHA2 family efflux MFS transporter permease subunit n=1 Tax=Actinomadura graeca TaxID=2750812 RepID=A0ABX8QSP7_9ACTN|nr:DHA2 family efflux MFS transporter permease subunit [Actinomadura graeca]QXJ19823.1 DHA2 family efflux MFS transporter permease subunit [Actinomadura graeca]